MNAMMDIPPYPAEAGVSSTITKPALLEGQKIRIKVTRTIETRTVATPGTQRLRHWFNTAKDAVGIAVITLSGAAWAVVA